MKQTFLADFRRIDGSYDGHDFYRFGCKQLKTVLKYLRGYREQAKEKHCEFLFPHLTSNADEFVCRIYETDYETSPDNMVFQCLASEL